MRTFILTVFMCTTFLIGNSYTNTDSLLVIDSPQVIYTDAQMPFTCDAQVSFLRKTDSTFWAFHLAVQPSGAQIFDPIFLGTLNQPFQKPLSRPSQNKNGWFSTYAYAWPWIQSIYQISPNELIGFTHNEKFPIQAYTNGFFTLGISYSNDTGLTWTFCGEIVTHPAPDTIPNRNIGGVPYIVVGNYFYVYFNDYDSAGVIGPMVARAPITDVITAARTHSVGLWSKYKNGSWNQPGLGGTGSRVIKSMSGTWIDTHGKATFVNSISKYVISLNAQNLHSLYLYTSTDGINWANESIIQTWSDGMCPYSTFAGFGTASNDCHTVGDAFCLFWTHKTSDYGNDTYYRSMIRVKNTPSSIHLAGPNMVKIPGTGTSTTAYSAYMNQSRRGLTLRFVIDKADNQGITVYAIDGKFVRKLEGGMCGPGSHTIVWNGLDNAGHAVPCGIYVFRFTGNGRNEIVNYNR